MRSGPSSDVKHSFTCWDNCSFACERSLCRCCLICRQHRISWLNTREEKLCRDRGGIGILGPLSPCRHHQWRKNSKKKRCVSETCLSRRLSVCIDRRCDPFSWCAEVVRSKRRFNEAWLLIRSCCLFVETGIWASLGWDNQAWST